MGRREAYMSVRLMGEVWGLDVNHARLLILLALADHADDRGRNIYPSLSLVAWKTGYSKRRVRAIVSELREQGILIQVTPSRWHRATHYRLNLDPLPRKSPLKREEEISPLSDRGRKSETLREEILSSREEAATSAKPSSESSLKSSGNPAAGVLKNDKRSEGKEDRRSTQSPEERKKLLAEQAQILKEREQHEQVL